MSAPNRGSWFGKKYGTIFEDPVLLKIAEKHKVDVSKIALSWNMSRDVPVIPMTSKLERAIQNISSLDVMLDLDDMNKINNIGKEHRVYDAMDWESMLNTPVFK